MRLTRLLKSRGHCNAIQALQCPEISAETRRYFFIFLGALLVDLVIHKQADIRAREGMGSDRDREIQLRLCSLNECNPSKPRLLHH